MPLKKRVFGEAHLIPKHIPVKGFNDFSHRDRSEELLSYSVEEPFSSPPATGKNFHKHYIREKRRELLYKLPKHLDDLGTKRPWK